jgi:hypothetical protein
VRRRGRVGPLALAALVLCGSASASAHVFVQPYTLPVPFWMYLYACAATVVLSFAVVAYVTGRPFGEGGEASPRWDLLPGTAAAQRMWRAALTVARAAALLGLALTVAGGFFGTADPRANINMTLFWVGLLLGWTYATAVAGDLYALVNPWRTLVDAIEAAGLDLSKARVRYPAWLGYTPAFVFYVALIWIELFTLPRPLLLSVALLIYTLATLAGCFVFGTAAWLVRGELFTVFFGLVGLMAPVDYQAGPPARIQLRAPFSTERSPFPMHPTLVLFVLFMLSSTSYDAVHQTFLWMSVYWQRLLPLLQPLWGTDVVAAQARLIEWYRVYQWAGLVLSPFLYLLLYLLVLWCAARLTRSTAPLWTLASEFAGSLVPIALVYHAAHYATILITDLPRLLPLAADPFGLGWRLFPIEVGPSRPLDMGVIWHSQVALVLAGHVAGVYLAHRTALRVFASRRGVVSQLPMLALMVAYTCVGLWVLSLPLDVPQVLPME